MSDTAIEVKTQIIPSSDLNGLENALGEIQQAALALPRLKERADAIVVIESPTVCKDAKQLLGEIRSLKKVGGFRIDPFLEKVTTVTNFLRGEKNAHELACDAIDAPLADKVRGFERKEREAAEAEQRRVNEERRLEAARKAEEERKERERLAAIARKEQERQAEIDRKERERELARQREAGEINKRELEKQKKLAAEQAEREKKEAAEAEARERERAAKDAVLAAANVQEVRIEPNIPKDATVPSRRNYKARVIDASRVPDQWWIIDEQALGAEARKVKKVGEIIPGVEFYEE